MGLRARRFERRVRDAIVQELARDVTDDSDPADLATLFADPPTVVSGSPGASRATTKRGREPSDAVDMRPFLDDELSARTDDDSTQRRDKTGTGARTHRSSSRAAASTNRGKGTGRSKGVGRKTYIPLEDL